MSSSRSAEQAFFGMDTGGHERMEAQNVYDDPSWRQSQPNLNLIRCDGPKTVALDWLIAGNDRALNWFVFVRRLDEAIETADWLAYRGYKTLLLSEDAPLHERALRAASLFIDFGVIAVCTEGALHDLSVPRLAGAICLDPPASLDFLSDHLGYLRPDGALFFVVNQAEESVLLALFDRPQPSPEPTWPDGSPAAWHPVAETPDSGAAFLGDPRRQAANDPSAFSSGDGAEIPSSVGSSEPWTVQADGYRTGPAAEEPNWSSPAPADALFAEPVSAQDGKYDPPLRPDETRASDALDPPDATAELPISASPSTVSPTVQTSPASPAEQVDDGSVGAAGRPTDAAIGETSEKLARLNHEPRNERRQVRVEVPLQVAIGGFVVPGADLSISGFGVDGLPEHLEIEHGAVMDVEIQVLCDGFRVGVPVRARAAWLDEKERRAGFEIVWANDRNFELLRTIVQGHLSGKLVTVDGLLAPTDAVIAKRERKTDTQSEAESTPTKRPLRFWLSYGAILGGLVILSLYAVSGLYGRFFTIEAAFASVTAPSVNMLAPDRGRFDDGGLRPGSRVARDDVLGRIFNPQLDSDLATLRATRDYYVALLGGFEEDDARASVGRKRTAIAALRAALSDQDDDDDRRQAARLLRSNEKGESIRAEIALLDARIAGLEQRLAANTLHSPCACTVYWTRGGSGGTWVAEGDRLFTLVPSDAKELLVEAQVPMSAVPNLRRTDEALIYLPERKQTIEGRVIDIVVDDGGRPRAGFPEWVRQDLSKGVVLIVPQEPLDEPVGTPVAVTLQSGGIGSLVENITAWLPAMPHVSIWSSMMAPKEPVVSETSSR